MREVAATYYFRCRRAPTETTNKWRQKVRQWLRTIWINHRLGSRCKILSLQTDSLGYVTDSWCQLLI